MKTNLKSLIGHANARIRSCNVQEAKDLQNDEEVIFIDVRERSELDNEGQIPNAIHIPRGMLEFTLDPQSPYYNAIFHSDNTFIFYCKSGSRSALASLVAMEMGLKKVLNLDGGYAEWSKISQLA